MKWCHTHDYPIRGQLSVRCLLWHEDLEVCRPGTRDPADEIKGTRIEVNPDVEWSEDTTLADDEIGYAADWLDITLSVVRDNDQWTASVVVGDPANLWEVPIGSYLTQYGAMAAAEVKALDLWWGQAWQSDGSDWP